MQMITETQQNDTLESGRLWVGSSWRKKTRTHTNNTQQQHGANTNENDSVFHVYLHGIHGIHGNHLGFYEFICHNVLCVRTVRNISSGIDVKKNKNLISFYMSFLTLVLLTLVKINLLETIVMFFKTSIKNAFGWIFLINCWIIRLFLHSVNLNKST